MPTRSYSSIQYALDDLNPAEKAINELQYYKKYLNDANHSYTECSSVISAIGELDRSHAALVNALYTYGCSYQSKENRQARQNNPNGDYSAPVCSLSYVPAAEHEKGFWEKTLNQIVLGDFSEDVTWMGSGVSIGAALFGVDFPMDVRDMVANAQKGEWGWAIVNGLCLLPVVGAFGKGGKAVVKAVDTTAEVFDTGATIIRQGSNLADSFTTLIRYGDDVTAVYRIGNKTLQTVDGVFSGVRNVDEISVVYKQADKVLWTASGGRKYVLSEGGFSILDAQGKVISTNANVKYLPDFPYIKKSDELHTALRKEFNSTRRSEFLKEIYANNMDDLKKLNLSSDDLAKISRGELPDGYQVHHKLSLDDGGDNSSANLILIRDTDHEIFTYYQNTFTRTNDFKAKGYAEVDWVVPTGQVYVPAQSVDVYTKWAE